MHYDCKASGLRIQQLRENHKETQEVLSERLNISLSMFKKIERGQKRASVDVLVAIAEYFGTTLDYIILGRNNSPEDLKLKLHMAIDILYKVEKQL